jgi:hypothetical protein
MKRQKAREATFGEDRDFYSMANAVRTYYILEHRRYVDSRKRGGPCTYGMGPLPPWDGRVGADGRVYERPIWFDIVSYALSNKVNPITLMRATFRAWNSPKPPYPNQFATPLGLQRAEYITRPRTVFSENLKMEDDRFKAATTALQICDHMDVEAATRRTLRDPTNGLSPLYRYCVGKLGDAEDVVNGFKQAAFQMYVFDRDAYDASWGDRIPQELRAAADQFYNKLLRCL